MKDIEKAYEITDARIQFVSLVGKAANKRRFLVAKADGDRAEFTTYGKIVKADAESHYVTGIVYEPMVEDTDGNFMSESEIAKACHWFAKNGAGVDLQHSFEPLDGASVVESWIAKSDCEIEGTPIRKGTWLMTVEVKDADVWDAIRKGDITGFSMGGVGTYSDENVQLEKKDKKGLLKQIAEVLGFRVVAKGQVAEIYERRAKADEFWTAFDALSGALHRIDFDGEDIYEADEDTIREALSEFGDIITAILADKEPIVKTLLKTRKANDEAEDADDPEADADEGDSNGAEEEEEDTKNVKKEGMDMTKDEMEEVVVQAVKKAMAADEPKEEPVEKTADEETVTMDAIEKMVADAVEAELAKEESIESMIKKAVAEAVEPVLKARGVPTNMNGETGSAQKDEVHFLHGIL